ncbi:ABC-ATPase domain-containing protein [Thaumasiovibrio subtropicus]|uniref:ABC-ATPase domain-containing protein n=1 Tax=Thaumasiovibrio subtropicus TaxID=1891207 RepID=UPI000B363767|nr:ABC-ATPase domain-containing protein [Thaumasiovibrio subtropicus]
MDVLEHKLKKIDRKNYRSYTSLKGEYTFADFTLHFDTIQADPYAPACRVRARRDWSLTDLNWLKETSLDFQRAARDFLTREFARLVQQDNAISIDMPGQTVLDRTSVVFDDDAIELRFRLNLPAEGRTIIAKQTLHLLTFTLPKVIRKVTLARELNIEALKAHCRNIEDQVALRAQLAEHNLIAFVANGAVLPRLAGNVDLPLQDAVPFESPATLATTLTTPHSGDITGMGIPKGITLIVGGGFHGKSTLLNAIEDGIYDHLDGDGRHHVVTDHNAVKIRAEDGRCVHQLDLSPYINHLPQGKPTTQFSTQNASGSTSQAAWLQESLEAGATSLLIDEDTSATNFMIRDERMQALVVKDQEPITPLVDRIAQLRDEHDISVLLVMGGSGDYLDMADTVIQLHDYQTLDVTEKAREVIAAHPTSRQIEANQALAKAAPRQLSSGQLKGLLEEGKFRIQVKDKHALRFGPEWVDLSALEQIAHPSQLHTVGWMWFQMAQQRGWVKQPARQFDAMLHADWFRTLPPYGDLARPRAIDVMAALNRMRKAEFK